LYDRDHLNLEPGFQRQSVWQERDRAQLIDSIIRNYPLPAIFLYKREEAGHLVFDVIDGKQRIESLLMFVGAMRGRFKSRTQLPGSDDVEWIDWPAMKRKGLQHLITGYEIPVIEVDGELGEIIEVFVRINSTGKALTRQEKLHARYYRSAFLKDASRLARKFEDYFLANKIFSAGQIDRMKHVEFMCELMLSLVQEDVLNKKTALDRVMQSNSIDRRQLKAATAMATKALNRVKKMFPQLRTTRLRQITDFYTLSVLIGKYEQERMILTERRRNQLAWDLLRTFTTRVDEVRELQRKAKGARPDQELYREYMMTVMQATDEVTQRRKRESIIDNILKPLFTRKDSQRSFTPEQRRIMWNTTANRTCTHKGCSSKLTWDDFTIDHVNPHSKGGRSQLENAALMCRAHNSSKGNRKRSVSAA
jgi:hypothetical protein